MDGQPFGEDFDWPTLAAHAGRVGRFIWYLESGICEIDRTLQEMIEHTDGSGRFAASEFINLIHVEDQPQVWLAAQEAQATGNLYRVEFRLCRPSGEVIWLAGHGKLTDVPGGGTAILGVNYDISETRNTQQRYELVAGEMEHRIKTLLSLVTSIYRGSASGAASVSELTDAFLPRLQALSALNGLAVLSGHKEIHLNGLVEAVLQPLTGRNITQDVDVLFVNATAAQILTLVLNELMTNATRYGGLADEAGSVSVKITMQDDELVLLWEELASYEISAPVDRSGFGMQVLNSMTAATFQGRPKFNWRKEGLQFQCAWPLDEMTKV